MAHCTLCGRDDIDRVFMHDGKPYGSECITKVNGGKRPAKKDAMVEVQPVQIWTTPGSSRVVYVIELPSSDPHWAPVLHISDYGRIQPRWDKNNGVHLILIRASLLKSKPTTEIPRHAIS